MTLEEAKKEAWRQMCLHKGIWYVVYFPIPREFAPFDVLTKCRPEFGDKVIGWWSVDGGWNDYVPYTASTASPAPAPATPRERLIQWAKESKALIREFTQLGQKTHICDMIYDEVDGNRLLEMEDTISDIASLPTASPAPAPPSIDWIPVSTGTPTQEGSYLVYSPTGDPKWPLIQTAWWHGDKWSMLPRAFERHVTHWAKLTAPER